MLTWYPIVENLTRMRNASDDHLFVLKWSWPTHADNLNQPRPMVEVATSPDFGLEYKGELQNMTVHIDYGAN